MGRVPSSVTSTQEPGTGSLCWDRKMALGLVTPLRPFSVMAKTPISLTAPKRFLMARTRRKLLCVSRSEEHTSELQSQSNLVCRLLLEKKKNEKLHHATIL